MKFNSNSGRTLFMTFIIVLVFVLIGAIAYFGITSYPEVITDLKIKIEKTFNTEKENKHLHKVVDKFKETIDKFIK